MRISLGLSIVNQSGAAVAWPPPIFKDASLYADFQSNRLRLLGPAQDLRSWFTTFSIPPHEATGLDGTRYQVPANTPDWTVVPAANSRGQMIEPASTNQVLNSGAPVTQDVVVISAVQTISFWGTGTVTLSGVATGTITGTGTADRVQLTVTPSGAGTVTVTISGDVRDAQLEQKPFATSYIVTTGSQVTRAATDMRVAVGDEFGRIAGLVFAAFTPAVSGQNSYGNSVMLSVLSNTGVNSLAISSTAVANLNNPRGTINNNQTAFPPAPGQLASQRNKTSFRYGQTNQRVALNGVSGANLAAAYVDTGAAIMRIGNQSGGSSTGAFYIDTLALWNTAQPGSFAEEITAA